MSASFSLIQFPSCLTLFPADGGNVPWTQGQTPIKEVLQLMRKERWTLSAEVELEYKIHEGSSAVKEVAKCVQYCKEALA